MDTDKQKQRRNVIGVAAGLVIFELAGGSVGELSLLDKGIKLQDAQRVIFLAYLALTYFSWRFWLYTRLDQKKFKDFIWQTIESSRGYRELVEPLVASFREKSGIAEKEAFQNGFNGVAPDEIKAEPMKIPIGTAVEFKSFRRKIVIHIDNPRGDYHLDREAHTLPFWRFEVIWFQAVGRLVIVDKAFSDLYVPYLLAFLAFGGLVTRWLA